MTADAWDSVNTVLRSQYLQVVTGKEEGIGFDAGKDSQKSLEKTVFRWLGAALAACGLLFWGTGEAGY
uniref:hypothetical protein n=1 Tax=Mesosutterella multiformis TaxID=2259133 RepID=UPI004029483D